MSSLRMNPRWLFPILTPLLGSCKTVDSSALKHEEGQIFAKVPAYNWADPSEAEAKVMLSEYAEGELLPASHPMVQHLQKILNAIDEMARALPKNQEINPPKTRAVVLVDPEPNAFVFGIGLRIRQAYRSSSDVSASAPLSQPDLESPNASTSVPRSQSTADEVLEISLSKKSYEKDAANKELSTVELRNSKIWDPTGFVAFWNETAQRIKNNCLINLDENNTLVFPGACTGNEKLKGGSQLELIAQAPFVVVQTGLLKELSEKAVTLVLAHELAHYYRGHKTTLTNFSPYFYEQTAENELRKPVPTDRHPEIAKGLEAVKDLMGQPTIKGSRYNPNLASLIFESVDSILTARGCTSSQSCSNSLNALRQILGDKAFSKVKEKIGFRPLDASEREIYLKFEKIFVEVSRKIGKIDPSKLKLSATDLGLADFFEFSKSSVDLAAWFDAAHQKIENALPKARKLYEEAARKNLGYYSTEEEADEIAAEIAARMGLSKNETTEPWMILLQKSGGDAFGNSYESCRELQKKDWKTKGSDLVLLGQLGVQHHSFCYRAFNSSREWDAHQMDGLLPAQPPFAFDAIRWKTLQAALPK